MKITFRDVQVFVLGLIIMFSSYNLYFAISGNMPPAHPGSNFTPEIAAKAGVIGLVVSLVSFYLIYLRKGSERITVESAIKMLAGACLFGLAGHLKSFEFELATVYFVLTCIFTYFGFLKKA